MTYSLFAVSRSGRDFRYPGFTGLSAGEADRTRLLSGLALSGTGREQGAQANDALPEADDPIRYALCIDAEIRRRD